MCRVVGKPAGIIRQYLEAQDGITVDIGGTAANLVEVIDGQVKLLAAADSVYIRFSNTAESYQEVYAFELLA